MCTNENASRCLPPLGPSSISLLQFSSSMKAFSENHPSAAAAAAAASVSSSSVASTSSVVTSGNNSMASMGLVVANGPQSSAGLLSQLPAATLDQYRLQLYNYAFSERLRYAHPAFLPTPFGQGSAGAGAAHPAAAAAAAAATAAAALGHLGRGAHDLSPFFLSYASKFDPRLYRPQEEPKPQHSYIGLIAMAILSSADKKLVLSDIYQYILDNYAYFRTRGPGWRNSIRHNLSLNDCFIKAGRSANGKGHYWAIHPANIEDFKKGDFRRRKAQRKVRKHMGLAVDEEDSPTPPSSPVPVGSLPWNTAVESLHHHHHHHQPPQPFLTGNEHSLPLLMMASPASMPHITSLSPSVSSDEGHQQQPQQQQQQRKRLFDVASLLGRNEDHSPVAKNGDEDHPRSACGEIKSNVSSPIVDDDEQLGSSPKRVKIEFDEDVDVVSEDHDDSEDDVFPSATSRPDEEERQAGDAPASAAAGSAESLTSSSLPDGRIDLSRRLPSQSLMIPTTSSAMWMRSVLAAPPMQPMASRQPSAGHPRHPQPPQPVPVSGMPPHYFNGLTVPHLPFLSASIATSMNEQLTKYYEQVAEAMRLNANNPTGREHSKSASSP